MTDKDDFDEFPIDNDPESVRRAREAMLAMFSGQVAVEAQKPVERRSDPLMIAVWGDLAREDRAQVSANLAMAIARIGSRVVLVNPGLVPEQQTEMFGFLKALDTSSAPLMETGIKNLLVSPGRVGGGDEQDAHQEALLVLRNIANAEVDVAVFDCGVSAALDTRDLFDLADHRLVVVRPGVTAIAATYGFLKQALARFIREALTAGDDIEYFDNILRTRSPKTTRDMVRFLDEERSDLGEWVEARVTTFQVTIVGHQLKSRADIDSLYALARMLGDFLSVKAVVLALEGAVRIHRSMGSAEGQELLGLAQRLMAADVGELRSERFTEADEGLPGPVSKYLRRHERCSVEWPVSIGTSGRTVRGVIEDVSVGGALIMCSDPLRIGETVSLRIEPLDVELSGEVRRVVNDRAGLEFDKSIAREVLDQVMACARTENSAG